MLGTGNHGSVVKSVCSYREWEFGSQNPSAGSQLPASPVPEDLLSSSVLLRCLVLTVHITDSTYTDIHYPRIKTLKLTALKEMKQRTGSWCCGSMRKDLTSDLHILLWYTCMQT